MLRRKAYDRLLEWKNEEKHNCLLVSGQRQIGKTFIISKFGKENYENLFYTDLSKDGGIREAMKRENVDDIVNLMKVKRNGESIEPGKTLIFIDEIQVSKFARSALKLFSLDGRYDVIASGSLLGVKLPNLEKSSDNKSEDDEEAEKSLVLPAGYESLYRMFSMDFEEYLWSVSFPQEEIDRTKACIHDREPLDKDILKTLESHFRDYMIVGGMPASVSEFKESGGDYVRSSRVIRDVLDTCMNDVMTYNLPVDQMRIREALMSIPSQLGQVNKKYMYSRIPTDGSRGYRNRYLSSLEWINGAGYTNVCYNLTDLTHPISIKNDPDTFKMYMADTGILNNMIGPEAMSAVYDGDYAYNMGAVVENAVAEGIMKCRLPVRYYQNTDNSEGKRMEIDFILESGRDLMAVEVKSGKSRRSPSLEKVSKVYSQVNRRIMLSKGNISTDRDGVEHYPLFAACFADQFFAKRDGPRFTETDDWL